MASKVGRSPANAGIDRITFADASAECALTPSRGALFFRLTPLPPQPQGKLGNHETNCPE